MKKYLLAAVLVMVSASAMADRVVSGATETGLRPYSTKAEACDDAKYQASRKRNGDEQVESYSKCDCEQSKNGLWTCSVDAKLEKKH
jgi:hypothetical protein